MKLKIVFFCLLNLVTSVVFADENAAKLDIEQQVKQFMAKENIPALAVAIIQNRKINFTAGYGVLDRESSSEIDQHTIFQIGSQSKMLTSMIALELVKEGKLALSDRLVELLPGVFPEASIAEFQTLTLEHLMVHRSGLPNYPKNVSRIDGDAFLGGYNKEMLLSALKSIELSFKPNEKWQYSNFNYAVLGYVLSQVSNKSYAELVQYYISDKYDLSNTVVALTEQQKTQLATPYRKDNRAVATQPWDMGLLAPHGGVYSSINDLALLMELQLAAYLEYGQSGVATPLVSTQIKYDTEFTQAETIYPGLIYGLGMFEASEEFPMFSSTVLFHGGDLDGFGCEYLFSAEHGVGVVLLTSSGGREFVSFARKLMEQLLPKPANKN